MVPPVGSSKKARAVNSGGQVAYCLVDGCNADLSGCREYHRRHKVCEIHSKSPEVKIGGLKQRFCQQCSRFHSLEEFDEGKRSCRKRLEGHNRRRRKPQPDPISCMGTFVPNYQGARLFPFSTAEAYPTSVLTTPVWAGEQETKLYNHHRHVPMLGKHSPYPAFSSCSDTDGKPSSFVHGSTFLLNNQALAEASSSQQFYNSSEASGCGHKMISPDLSKQALNLNRALSLLSSPPVRSPKMSPSHMVPPNSTPLPQSFGLSLHNNTSLGGINSALVPDSGEGMFHLGQGLFSKNGESSQTLPFCWE